MRQRRAAAIRSRDAHHSQPSHLAAGDRRTCPGATCRRSWLFILGLKYAKAGRHGWASAATTAQAGELGGPRLRSGGVTTCRNLYWVQVYPA